MRRTELARSCFRPSLGGRFDRARFASVALRSTNDDARSWLIVIACPAGWGGTAEGSPPPICGRLCSRLHRYCAAVRLLTPPALDFSSPLYPPGAPSRLVGRGVGG